MRRIIIAANGLPPGMHAGHVDIHITQIFSIPQSRYDFRATHTAGHFLTHNKVKTPCSLIPSHLINDRH